MFVGVGVFIVAVASMAALGLPWPLVALSTASFIAGAFAMCLMRASAVSDSEVAEGPASAEAMAMAEAMATAEATPLELRVRRAVSRWPLTELDPIERATFAGAVAQARDFDDLDLPWQELILAAERGGVRRTYELDQSLYRVVSD